jgi:hypothetical protein
MDTNLIGLPSEPPAQKPSVDDVSRDAQRAHDIAGPAPRPVHGLRAGWMVTTVVAIGSAWVGGWLVGVAWAWSKMAGHWW